MEMKLDKRLIVSIGGMAAALAVLVGLYVVVVRPRMKAWNEVRVELKKSRERLVELRKLFKDRDDPRDEVKVLRQELKNLGEANASLDKIKKPGLEADELPEEINDPDPEIRNALVNGYMKEVMSVTEQNMKQDLGAVKITAPDFKLYNRIDAFPEAAYYMNRANGLQGIINAIVKTQSTHVGQITFAELELEDYKKGFERRRASQNVLSYSMEMTMNVQSLMSLMYNLKEEEGYYFVSDMTIKPATSRRFSSGDSSRDLKLLVDARINTVMIFKSEVEKALKQAVEKSATANERALRSRGGKVGGLMGLAVAMKRVAEEQAAREADKKWYEFWK